MDTTGLVAPVIDVDVLATTSISGQAARAPSAGERATVDTIGPRIVNDVADVASHDKMLTIGVGVSAPSVA